MIPTGALFSMASAGTQKTPSRTQTSKVKDSKSKAVAQDSAKAAVPQAPDMRAQLEQSMPVVRVAFWSHG